MNSYFFKSVLLMFPMFLTMGLVGNLSCSALYFFWRSNNQSGLQSLLKISSWIASIVGLLGFITIGAFYAVYALSLKEKMSLWLAILLVSIIIILLTRFSHKEHKELLNKISVFTENEMGLNDGKMPFLNFVQVVNRFTLSAYGWLAISYFIFLLIPSYASKITFGLTDYLLKLIS